MMNRFSFLRLAVLAVLVAGLSAGCTQSPAAKSRAAGPILGLQTWTCRNMTFDQVVDFAVKHGITHLQFIKAHFDPAGPREDTLRKKAILESKGLTAYSFGVNGTSMNKEENRKLFEFAKLMGIGVIIVEPRNMAEWDNLEELVKEYDIKLAIHNHGRGTVYGDPATVKKVLAERDRRIGVCLDIGHVVGAGFDATTVFREYGDRVYDLHFKDKTVQTDASGKRTPVDTEIGAGDTKFPELFAAIKETGWAGVMAIETDSRAFAEDPNKLVAGAKIFFDAQVKK